MKVGLSTQKCATFCNFVISKLGNKKYIKLQNYRKWHKNELGVAEMKVGLSTQKCATFCNFVISKLGNKKYIK